MEDSFDRPQPSPTAALVRWFLLIAATFAVLAFAGILISNAWKGGPASEAAAAGTAVGGDPFNAPAPSYPTPEFELASLDGRRLGPPDFAGEVVVIDLWATWCGPCRIQAEMIEKLHAQYDGKGVQFLAINVGEDEATVRAYVDKKPFPYPVLLDPREELMTRYKSYGLPTVLVIDREGKVSFVRTGLTDVPTLRRELARAGLEV